MEPDQAFLSPPRPRRQGNNLQPYTSNLQDRRGLSRRQSLRLRPSEVLENAEPTSPLNLSVKSGTSSRTASSKMSLFNLFSRPKVERQRGYTERGHDIPNIPPLPEKHANASKPELVVQVERTDDVPSAPSVQSGKSNATKSTSRLKSKEPIPPAPTPPQERKAGSFQPPPLFQAYPQSSKDGRVEISTMSAETIHHKTKQKRGSGLRIPAAGDHATEDISSMEGRRGSALRHIASGYSAHVDLPEKIFVLATSGYLLQYAESGPSDRLPERMLHLGKDSAAFACDLVPGKHHVLQVSQAVDQEDGVIIVNSGSFFSKLGFRSAASKRMASCFLLVMPNAKEMESWMTAIRRQIEMLGGKKIRPETAARPKSRGKDGNQTELKKAPSHRYQVKRNPSKVSSVPTTPVTSPKPDQTTFPATPQVDQDKSDEETATLDGIEMEADKLDESDSKPVMRNRSPSEAPSMSSTAVSTEQQQLNNIRSSLSTRASQTGTVATTVETSGPNSLAGSPTTLENSILETSPKKSNPVKQSFRMSTSYSIKRRRSAAPLPITREIPTPPAIGTTSPSKVQHSVIEESPVAAHFPKPQSPPKRKRLSNAYSEPNFHSLKTIEKHDSKVPTPRPVSPLSPEASGARPDSFVGDLPLPSSWPSSRAPSRRSSTMQSSSNQAPHTQEPASRNQHISNQAATTQQPASRELYKSRRMSSFSIPLKVNPSGAPAQASTENVRRRSQLNEPDSAGESPTVHTLTAKVEPSTRASVLQTPSTSNPPIPSAPQRSPSSRLSLFPSPIPSPAGSPPAPPQRSSSAMGQHSCPKQAQINGRMLRRPNSVQVRSDPAPFLSSVRTSTGPTTTVPIRGMKPSRSASNVAALAKPSPPEAFKGLRFDTDPVPEENDTLAPLNSRPLSPMPNTPPEDVDNNTSIGRAVSPLPLRPGSRNSFRKGPKTRSSLPELDFGMPVVGLGPPAPPPSTPLPPPPPASRTTSPEPMDMHRANAGIDSVAGLGISVSS